MTLQEVQAKRKALETMKKPEWNLMTQEDKFKDPQYCQYIYEELLISLEHAKECKRKVSDPDLIRLFDSHVETIEAALEHFDVGELK